MPPSSKLSKISRVFQQTCPVHDSHVQGLSVLGGIIRNHSTTGNAHGPDKRHTGTVFKLSEKGTTVKTEILAGLTTFVAMAYIIFVNPSILADAGIPKEAAIAATVWSAVIGSAAMGLWANFPVAVAPGMGLNAFFAYYVCGVLGLHWTVALGAVFFSGIVFLLLTVTHVRQLLIDAVPMTSSMPSSSASACSSPSSGSRTRASW